MYVISVSYHISLISKLDIYKCDAKKELLKISNSFLLTFLMHYTSISICSFAQSLRPFNEGISFLLFSVNEYSTRGGISRY